MIIDILRGDCGHFVVSNAVNDVAITPTAALCEDIASKNLFDFKDNFNILSCTVFIPYQFTSGSSPFRITVQGKDTAATVFNLPFGDQNVGSSGSFVPVENIENDINAFVPFSISPASLKFGIWAGVGGFVSMLNVPAVLNGLTLHTYLHLKVAHNLALV